MPLALSEIDKSNARNIELARRLDKADSELEIAQAIQERDHKVTLKLLDENLELKEKLRRAEGLEDTNEKLDKSLRCAKNTVTNLRSEMVRVRAENQTFANSNSVLIKSNRCLNEEVKRLQEEAARPPMIMAGPSPNYMQLREELTTQKYLNAGLLLDFSDLRKELEEERCRRQLMKPESWVTADVYEALEKDHARLENALSDARSENDRMCLEDARLRGVIGEVQKERNKAWNERDELNAQFAFLTDDRDKDRKEINRLRGVLRRYQKERREFSKELVTITRSRDAWKRDTELLERLVTTARNCKVVSLQGWGY